MIPELNFIHISHVSGHFFRSKYVRVRQWHFKLGRNSSPGVCASRMYTLLACSSSNTRVGSNCFLFMLTLFIFLVCTILPGLTCTDFDLHY